MNQNSKILTRGVLTLQGLSKTIKIWWTPEQIRDWQKNHSKYLIDSYSRLKTTPYSMIEFESCDFGNLEFTDEKCASDSFLVKESTLLFHHLTSNQLPFPLGTMHDLFDYPSTLIGLLRPIDHEVTFFDYSGYFNYQFLKEDRADISQYLSNSKVWKSSNFNDEDFFIAEYSRLSLT